MKPSTRKIIEFRAHCRKIKSRRFPPEFVAKLRRREARDYWREREQAGPRAARLLMVHCLG